MVIGHALGAHTVIWSCFRGLYVGVIGRRKLETVDFVIDERLITDRRPIMNVITAFSISNSSWRSYAIIMLVVFAHRVITCCIAARTCRVVTRAVCVMIWSHRFCACLLAVLSASHHIDNCTYQTSLNADGKGLTISTC